MIRKWSYLNSANIDPTDTWFNGASSVYNFKVFRMTTRFKKYNRVPVTKIVRKKYARRKHRTNWLRLSYITKSWVFFFLKSRQFVRFYQSLGLFNVQAFSASTLIVTKNFADIVTSRGFTTFSCSQTLLNTFKGNGQFSKYYINPLLGSQSSGLSVRSIPDLTLVENINPGLINYDNLLYPYNLDNDKLLEYKLLYILTTTQIFKNSLQHIKVLYKILITLTLINL